MKRYLPFVIIAAVLLVAVAVGSLWLHSSTPQVASVTPAPSGPLTPRSSVLLEEFGDYQCPPCGGMYPRIEQLKGEFGNKLRVTFYQFPLVQIHKHALTAAHAAVAARLQGKFWEMHKLLYENQSAWSEAPDLRPVVTSFAQRLGLDMNRFARDLNGPQAEGAVMADIQRGEAMGVSGTPTLFIDGRKLTDEEVGIENLRKLINERLSGR